jgi:hypothetical protein
MIFSNSRIQDFIMAQPLNNVVVLMIYKNKSNVSKLKNQNGGLIQDGDENIFYFSHNKPPFRFFGLATLIEI